MKYEQQFINEFKQDTYYKTVINNQSIIINENDFKIYKEHIQKYNAKKYLWRQIYIWKYSGLYFTFILCFYYDNMDSKLLLFLYEFLNR